MDGGAASQSMVPSAAATNVTRETHPPEVDKPSRRKTHQSNRSSKPPFFRLDRRSETIHNDSRVKKSNESLYDYFACYDLRWEDLKSFLQSKWPRFTFEDNPQRNNDKWVFKVPERLTEDDRNNIAALRDRIKNQADKPRLSFSDSE